MLLRNLLLVIGALFVLAGVGLLVVFLGQVRSRPPAPQAPAEKPEVLLAARPIPAGTLLRKEDVKLNQVEPGEVRPGELVRSQEEEYLGAVSRREFKEGEPLIASDLTKPSERNFLAAVLKPGERAMTILVDATQSAAGLVLPGDYVDIMLTQSLGGTSAGQGNIQAALGTVSETVLRNVRVIAVDQKLNPQPVMPASVNAGQGMIGVESRIPKTITLELSEQKAGALLVAEQLGKIEIAVRPLEQAGTAQSEAGHKAEPVWASEVSMALSGAGRMRRHPGGEPAQVGVRVYPGPPKSIGYLCTASACVPSEAPAVTSQAPY